MGIGQQQQQENPPPKRRIYENNALNLPKPNRRKKMQDLDLSELLEKKPEDFLKQIKQLPGQ
jgi:hypothetical protein